MRRECACFEDLLWDCARDGMELHEDVRRHVTECRRCAAVFADAGKLTSELWANDRLPLAPDCRASVIGRISDAKQGFRIPALVWAAPVAAAIVVIAFLWPILVNRHTVSKPVVVQKDAPKTIEKKVPKVNLIEEPVAQPEDASVSRSRAMAVRKPKRAIIAYKKPQRQKTKEAEHVAVVKPPAGSAQPADSPSVSAVIVSWNNEEQYERSYGYVQYNHESGVTTTCHVNRVGNSIELEMESTSDKTVGGGNNDENTGV